MPYLGYLLAQAVKAGQTVASAITSATNYVTRVGSSVVELSASAEVLKSPSNGSAVFNGTSDYIIVADPNFSGADSFTVGGWVYINSISSGDGIILAQETTGWGLQGIITGSDNFRFYAGDGSGSTYSLVSSPSGTAIEKTWIHVMATHTSSLNKIYVNGNLSNSATAANLVSSPPNPFYIGLYSSLFDGSAANMVIWSRALSAEEVRSVMMKSYDDLSASETKGLVSWYALDDISGTTVPDSHGNFNGTAY
jgi:hypothetical protein